MGVRVGFLETTKPVESNAKPGVLAPAAAIVKRAGKDVVFVLVDDQARQRSVSIGRSLGEDREVLSGLADGEEVILDPSEKIVDGARVRLAREEADADANNE
jgi:hypothetical protein